MIAGTSVAAARRMHVTQPAISRLIADLETHVGFNLFNRVRGRLEPTVAGTRFYKSVEENFLGLERLQQVADAIRGDASVGLNVACLPVIASTLLPPSLEDFFSRFADVPVRVDSVKVPDVLTHLQNHTADVALSIAFPDVAGIVVEPLLSMTALCAMPAGHRLASRSVIRPCDLDDERLIGWLPNATLSYQLEREIFESAGARPFYTVLTDTAHTRYAMVAQGLGVSIVEPFGSKVWQAHGIVVRPFESRLAYDYVIAYPRNSLRSTLVNAFRESTLRAVAAFDFYR